ncbi:hypothetical protein HK105_205293 [Polyrhizophydium stewartii]|uniref:Phosphate-induced protein 1 conserved region-domain-containing protein n=1 Tax=Polyrhizophydium stewartii TaxID=2732419 RepID=A0ABR4N6P0_9FUNG
MVSVTSIFAAVAALAFSSAAAGRSFIAPIRGKQPSSLASNPIHYNIGAPVLTGPVNVYLIYYGSWSSSQKSIVETFIKGIGTSKWWNIERKYYFQRSSGSTKTFIGNQVSLAGTATDNYSLGTSLSGNDLPNIIQSKVDSGALPEDTNAVYFVLTAGDVSESIRPDLGSASFCSDYCGYHVSTTLSSGNRVFYAMAGNPTACLSGCAPPSNQNVSPNGDVGVDAALSVIAHELAEAVSDPQSDGTRAWEDNSGAENADKCAYTYGTTSRASNGASFNLGWGGRNYLIQQNWDPVKQACALTA